MEYPNGWVISGRKGKKGEKQTEGVREPRKSEPGRRKNPPVLPSGDPVAPAESRAAAPGSNTCCLGVFLAVGLNDVSGSHRLPKPQVKRGNLR